MMAANREMTQLVVARYAIDCERLIASFGAATPIDQLRALHFTAFRATFPATWGPAFVGGVIQRVRTLFKFAYESELLESPIRFGPDFRKPKLKFYRRAA